MEHFGIDKFATLRGNPPEPKPGPLRPDPAQSARSLRGLRGLRPPRPHHREHGAGGERGGGVPLCLLLVLVDVRQQLHHLHHNPRGLQEDVPSVF